MAKNNIWQWSSTNASNTDIAGTDITGSTGLVKNGDNAIREIMAQIAASEAKGSNVASASTVTLGTGRFFHITGTTTITDIDFTDAVDGRWAVLEFDGALTLTHNATTLTLPGGTSITTAAGDRAFIVQDSSDNVHVMFYQPYATGTGPFLPLTSGTLTGDLRVFKADPAYTLDKAASGQTNYLIGRTNNSNRWIIFLGDATAETGSNAGSSFALRAYDDSSTLIDVPIFMGRAAGSAFQLYRPLSMSSAAINEASTVTIASGSTVNIGAAASNQIIISGTTTITAFDTVAAGITREVLFSGALTLTHNGTSLILPGTASITTAANDTAKFRSLGSGNWVCLWYKKADGTSIGASGGMTLLGTLTTTSGTTQSLTGIASGYQQFYIELDGVTGSSNSTLNVALGSGSTSYGTAGVASATANSVPMAGFIIIGNVSSTVAAAKSALASVMASGVSGTVTNVSTPTGAAAVATAVRFSWSTGSFTAGTIRIYGVK